MAEATPQTNAQQVASATEVKQTGSPPPPAAAANDDFKSKYSQLRDEHDKKVREQVVERRKWSLEKKTFGEKLSEGDKLRKQFSIAQSRPVEFLQSVYGEKWADMLREVLVSGASPAEMLQAQVERIQSDFDSKLKARDEEAAKAQAEQQKASEAAARRELLRGAADFVADKGSEYPVFKKLGDTKRVAAAIAQRIEQEYFATERRDEETGETLPGRIISAKEAADLLEADILSLAEEAVTAEKYRPKFAEKLQLQKEPGKVAPAQQPQVEQQQSSAQQPRRTLTNNLTGSTASRVPATTDEERRARALAAREAVRSGKAP